MATYHGEGDWSSAQAFFKEENGEMVAIGGDGGWVYSE